MQQALLFEGRGVEGRGVEVRGQESHVQARPARIQLADAEIHYMPAWLSAAQSAALMQQLLQGTPWRQDSLRFAGKLVPVPRLQAWYGESASNYGYSGLRLAPLPWTDALAEIRQRLEASLNLRFNSVLVNYYRNGMDSVAWHSDNESTLGPDPSIASLSLGAPRAFQMKHRKRGSAGAKDGKLSITLEDGSLLVMGAGVQQHWQHHVPKQPAVTAPRINLTFRLILPMA